MYHENQHFHLLSDKGTSKPQKWLIGFKGLKWSHEGSLTNQISHFLFMFTNFVLFNILSVQCLLNTLLKFSNGYL
jgi:hypothetical protein